MFVMISVFDLILFICAETLRGWYTAVSAGMKRSFENICKKEKKGVGNFIYTEMQNLVGYVCAGGCVNARVYYSRIRRSLKLGLAFFDIVWQLMHSLMIFSTYIDYTNLYKSSSYSKSEQVFN